VNETYVCVMKLHICAISLMNNKALEQDKTECRL
jgi:hypothetical protein